MTVCTTLADGRVKGGGKPAIGTDKDLFDLRTQHRLFRRILYTRQGRLRDADVDMGTTVLADTSGGMFMYGQYGRDPVPFRGY